jgi:hypothetical protein
MPAAGPSPRHWKQPRGYATRPPAAGEEIRTSSASIPQDPGDPAEVIPVDPVIADLIPEYLANERAARQGDRVAATAATDRLGRYLQDLRPTVNP